MNDANRDLLVLTKSLELSSEEMDRQIAALNAILFHIENWQAFCVANEILDIKRHKIVQKPYLIQKILREKKIKAFVFTSNKN